MPIVRPVTNSRLPAEGARVNSKNAEPPAAWFNAPVRAAAPMLLAPEKVEVGVEAEVVLSSGVVPLLFPCVTVPPVMSAVRPLVGFAVGVAVGPKSQNTVLGGGGFTVSVAAALVADPR